MSLEGPGALRQACPCLLCGRLLGGLSMRNVCSCFLCCPASACPCDILLGKVAWQTEFKQPQILRGLAEKSEVPMPPDQGQLQVSCAAGHLGLEAENLSCKSGCSFELAARLPCRWSERSGCGTCWQLWTMTTSEDSAWQVGCTCGLGHHIPELPGSWPAWQLCLQGGTWDPARMSQLCRGLAWQVCCWALGLTMHA